MDKRPSQSHKTRRSERNSLVALAPWLGMAVPFALVSRLSPHVDGAPTALQIFAAPYPGLFLVCLIVILAAARHGKGGVEAPRNAFPSTALVAVDASSAIFVAVSMLLSNIARDAALLLMGSFVGGMGVAWMYIRWGTLYCRQEIRRASGTICLSVATAGMLKIAISLLPAVASAAVCVVLVAVGWFSLRHCSRMPIPSPESNPPQSQGSNPGAHHTLRDIWIFPLALVILCGSLGLLYNVNHVQEAEASLATELGFATEAIAALAVYWWVCIRKKSLDVVGITTALAVVIASGVLALSCLGPAADAAFNLCTNIDHSLLTLFLWIILVDLANRLNSNPYRVFAAGWLLRSVPFWTLGSLGKVLDIELTPAICAVLIYVVVVVLALVILGHNVSTDKILDSLRGRVRGDNATIEQRCAAAAARYGLTARETDVLTMLSRGRSRPHIAEVLDLSENTVRGYTKNVYKKLGIHDRQSLFALIEGFTPDSGVR